MLACSSRALAITGAVLGCVCTQARAQTSVFATGSAKLTYTDNLFNRSSRVAPGGVGRQETWFVTLSPGVGLTHEAPRASYDLTYSHSFIHYLTAIRAQAHGDTALARARYQLSPVDLLAVQATAVRTSTVLMLREEESDSGQAQPDTTAEFLSGSAQQSLTHRYSPNWVGRESVSFRTSKPIRAELKQPWRFYAAGRIGAEHEQEYDAWALEWTTTYYHSLPVEREGQDIPRAVYVQGGPLATWRHELSEEWQSEVHAGLALGSWSGRPGPVRLVPAFGAALLWEQDNDGFRLGYTGVVTPNLYTNQLYFSDTGTLAGRWGFLPDQHLFFFSSHAFSRNRTLTAPGESRFPAFYTWTSSAGVRWSPEGILGAELRYDHREQFGSNEAMGISAFYRNQVSLDAQIHWPEPN
jgi:hypothetical protein